SDRRVVVWVQRFKDRDHLMLQWLDPHTGKRKSQSAGTADGREAEKKRADLEYELNHGLHHEPSKMSWERFPELFEGEFLPATRLNTRRNYTDPLDLFEELARPALLGKITERTLSLFIAEMRKRKTRGRDGMMASTIKVRLQFLHTVLAWAVEQKFLPRVPNF